MSMCWSYFSSLTVTWLLVPPVPPLMTQWLKHTHSEFTGVVYSKSYLLKYRIIHGEALKSYCSPIPDGELTNRPCFLMVSPENFCKARHFGGGRKRWQPGEGGGNRNKSWTDVHQESSSGETVSVETTDDGVGGGGRHQEDAVCLCAELRGWAVS